MSLKSAVDLKRLSNLVRLSAHVGWEQVSRPKYTSTLQVPSSAETLTPEWLTDLFCREVPGAEVVGFDRVGGSDGTSSRRALRIQYNRAGEDADLPTRVFTKSAKSLRSRLTLGPGGKIDNEIGFYLSVRPKLDIEAPRAWYAAHHRPSGRALIVLDDVAAQRDADFYDPFHHVNREQAESMVRLMAGYHGPMWNNPTLNRQEFPWLRSTFEYQTGLNQAIPFEQNSANGIARAASVIPDELLGRDQELWNAHMRAIEISSKETPTMLHWDMHIGNWYAIGSEMGLSDWGMVKGQWAGDVSYALSSALTVEDRRAWEEDLIKLYVAELANHGGPLLDFDKAWLAYRQQMLHAFYFWVYTIGAGALQPNMQPDDISLVNIERMASAVADLKSVAAVDE
ncbi:aminoglycoside phosphotransferase family protein [Rhodococcus opacus]|uniref:Aminoglycoside phosphotransferase domain-containing protein n=1 Tax=Rhodococcus opacus TaxID=37919 RepID=A0A076EZQ8_RHOOP|nr:aminoglycoside phosphotransferase family protein [Rhodococcus opacus]AII10913.1 hypothetical protein EP51_43040 [Rhodococcus opacus]